MSREPVLLQIITAADVHFAQLGVFSHTQLAEADIFGNACGSETG